MLINFSILLSLKKILADDKVVGSKHPGQNQFSSGKFTQLKFYIQNYRENCSQKK